jgi:hypothetical protein
MRVSMKQRNPNFLELFPYGQVEDYTVNITESPFNGIDSLAKESGVTTQN